MQTVQYIRLIDVFIIAPLLLIVPFIKTVPMWLKIVLASIGLATLIYNAYNFIKQQNEQSI